MELKLDKKQYVDFKVYSVTPINKKYGFRIKLIYDDDTYEIQQNAGYKTKKEAEKERTNIIGQLYNKTYIIYPNIKVKEYFEYWLEDVMAVRDKFSYNSYMSYRNVINNYIVPSFGGLKIATLNMSHIKKFYKEVAAKSQSVTRIAKTVINTALEYAKQKGIISVNCAYNVDLPKEINKKPYRIRNIDTSKTLTLQQAKILIDASKKTPIHLEVMFAMLMGMRISEINDLKYSNIDWINRKIYLKNQLGVNLKKYMKEKKECPKEENKKKRKKAGRTKDEIELKTKSSERELDIPDILFEEILEQRKIYEKNRKRRINDKTNPFNDAGYICCSSYGKPRSRGFYSKYYKELLKENNLPNIRFHDLRHSYTTILLKANFDVKAVSQLLGHASEIVTVKVYCDTEQIIYDCLKEIEPYIEDVITEDEEQGIIYDYSSEVDNNILIDEYYEKLMA